MKALPEDASAQQLPDVSAPRFIGRTAELRQLATALATPQSVVLIEGEAGIGKTRLMQRALNTLSVAGLRALVAVCPPMRKGLTLGPVVDALRDADAEWDRLTLSPLAGVLRPLFPERSRHLPTAPEPLTDAGASQHRLFRALTELLDAMAISILVVEDLHWADDTTLDFLLHLSSRPGRRASMVLTYRPEEVHPSSALLRVSSRSPVGTPLIRISLGALDIRDTGELMSSMLGGERVSEAFRRVPPGADGRGAAGH